MDDDRADGLGSDLTGLNDPARDPVAAARWRQDWAAIVPALMEHGERSKDPAVFRRVADGCAFVLAGDAPAAGSVARGRLLALRANALRRVGIVGDDDAALEGSVGAFDTALALLAGEAARVDRAIAQARQASALSTLGRANGDDARVRRAIAGFDAALAELRQKDASKDWAIANVNRGNALSHLGARDGDAAMLEDAVACYDQALLVYTRADWPQDWAETQSRRAAMRQQLATLRGDEAPHDLLAALLARFLTADPAEMRVLLESDDGAALLDPMAVTRLRGVAEQASAAGAPDRSSFFAAHAVLLEACRSQGVVAAFATLEHGPSTGALGGIRATLAELRSLQNDPTAQHDRAKLERQVALARTVLAILPREHKGELWAAIQGTLGAALQSLGDLTGDAARLEAAVAAYRDALMEYTRERAPMNWATTQNNLGIALRSLGVLTGDAARLEAAVAAYRDALEIRTRERAPMEWAMTQTNLGTALQSLGALTGDAARLEAAVAAYRDALMEYTRERAPMNWATTRNNLGIALQSLGDRTGDAARLEAAVAAYRDALEIRTRERAPMEWAMTQNNLGTALRSLGFLTGDAVRLVAAVAAYRDALMEYTRERAPMNWAATQNNLGGALQSLGALTGDAARLEAAVAAYRDALMEYTRERAPMDWATTQNNLSIALQSLGDRTGDAARLEAAVAAYRDALEIRTRERAPMDWATTQNNLGSALRSLGDLTGEAARHEAAVAAYRDALKIRTREHAPMDWAATQTHLGIALMRLGQQRGDTVLLEEAITALQGAHGVLAVSGAEDSALATAMTLSRLYVQLQRHAAAVPVLGSAIKASEAALVDAARSEAARRRSIARVGDLYGLLGLCHLRVGEAAAALSAVESGRARLLAQALRHDAPQRAEAALPETARAAIATARAERERLRHLLGLRGGADTLGERPRRDPPPDVTLATLEAAQETYLGLLRRHGILRPTKQLTVGEMQVALPSGAALAALVITEAACFALLLRPDGSVREVALPDLTEAALLARISAWAEAYNTRKTAGAMPRGSAPVAAWNTHITETLCWLWQHVMDPLDAALRDPEAGITKETLVVLLPTGLLGLLPLLAARPAPDSPGFDAQWQASLAPSVRALRRSAEITPSAQRVLMVGNPHPPGSDLFLPGALEEAAMLRQCFPGATHIPLLGGAATKPAVLAALPRVTHAHLSVHGGADLFSPEGSGLQLAQDAHLTVAEMRHTRLDMTRLVFLSACETGLSGIALPEEFVGLPATLLGCGAQAAIATLWPVYNDAAWLVSYRFYRLWLDADGRERWPPAVALREAQAWLRGVTFAELKRDFPPQGEPGNQYLELRTVPAVQAGRGVREAILMSMRDGVGLVRPLGRPVPADAAQRPIFLRLGGDLDRPFANPCDSAAFTLTGS